MVGNIENFGYIHLAQTKSGKAREIPLNYTLWNYLPKSSVSYYFLGFGGLVLIGKAAVLKTAGFTPLGVRVPRPPRVFLFIRWFDGEVAELAEGTGLLNLRRGNSTEGSNPSLSAF